MHAKYKIPNNQSRQAFTKGPFCFDDAQRRLVVDTGNFVSLMGAGLTEDVSDGDGEVVVWAPLSLLLPGLLVSGSLHSSQGLSERRQGGQ